VKYIKCVIPINAIKKLSLYLYSFYKDSWSLCMTTRATTRTNTNCYKHAMIIRYIHTRICCRVDGVYVIFEEAHTFLLSYRLVNPALRHLVTAKKCGPLVTCCRGNISSFTVNNTCTGYKFLCPTVFKLYLHNIMILFYA
jgi:hypothetical protein